MTPLLQNWVSHQAESRPEAVAVLMQGESLTYGQLEERSNRLARLLKAVGCCKGDRICLLLPKSIEAILAILGVLKADCIYVPMDITSPAGRLRGMLEACGARCILAASSAAHILYEFLADEGFSDSVRIGWMESGSSSGGFNPDFTVDDLDSVSSRSIDYRNNTRDVAHILFTSGSTGVPKGVMITHSNVIHFVEWATKYFGFTASDRVSGHPPLHFDLSTFDIFGTCRAGAQLFLVPPDVSLLPQKAAEFIRQNELTQWFSVPSLLNYMARFDVVRQNDFPALKRLLWCGEHFPTPALIYWMRRLPHVSFTNLYGPTETTIASSYYRVPACPENETAAIPIGTACDTEALLVLDDRLKPVAPGETGDLYISGTGLSPGYWNDAARTKAAFFDTPPSFVGHQRIYKTGDLASVGEHGLVYLHGRTDSQIKSRGYRIELGEIETALHAIKELRECAVVAADTNGFEGTSIVCAYVPEPGIDVSPQSLREQLAQVLPHYMVPSHWMPLPALPQNANGKIDRPKLRQHFQQMKQPPAAAG